MASFEEALAAAKQGKRIKHKGGMNKWLMGVTTDKGFRLVHEQAQFGLLLWVPHQWEIAANDWEVQ